MEPYQLSNFEIALSHTLTTRTASQGIGTLGEKSLHAVLKRYYQPDESLHERKVGRMTVDAVLSDGSLLEIQTRGFSSLRKILGKQGTIVCGASHHPFIQQGDGNSFIPGGASLAFVAPTV